MRLYYGEEFADTKRTKITESSKVKTLGELYAVLRQCWSKETAYPSYQAEWVKEDPSYG